MDIKNPIAIITLHDSLIAELGGENGLISEHLLLSALMRPFTGLADGVELYPTITDKAAALIHSLIKNHPFLDGNKRTAAQVTMIFLRENNYEIIFTQNEIIEFVLSIAKSEVDFEYIKEWIGKRLSVI
ncbi:MAG: type II toxin-antitoxin system death-on-curing family toxin [Ignavibacteriae bacterium]|nr:MAG: type II toxin-antitoxin system death-on-curing family toxin [Ignavibacteriota bacterium]